MIICDAHLDLAYNAVRGRDVVLPAAQQRPDDQGIPSVGLPDLRDGGVGLVCATIFCQPCIEAEKIPGYRTAQEARLAALAQLAWYQRQIREERLQFVKFPCDLGLPLRDPLRAILLMEGADALQSTDDLPEWFDAGLRIVGLAWRQTGYAGGTKAPGPLSARGVEMVKALDAAGLIHDISHMAEEAFWQLMEKSGGTVMASHSNCQALVPGDRQLSDAMIKAIVARGGMIGINFYHRFLMPPEEFGKRRATLADVIRHVRHICDLAGDARHVGLGTDMDGGLGREQIPVEIESSADLPKVADALLAAGFVREDVEGIMGRNWTRFFARNLKP